MTIPWLELQVAVLASSLKTNILSELKLKVNQVFLWSDSFSFEIYKKSHTCEEGGAHLRISFWHLLMNLKNK